MKKTSTRLKLPFTAFAMLVTLWSSAQTFTKTGAYDTIVTTPQVLKLHVSGLQPNAYGTATLTIYYEGDFGASSEFISIFGENNYALGQTQPYFNGNDCMADSTTFYFPALLINTWSTDDTLKFTGMTSSNVDYFCSANHAKAKIRYNYCLNGPVANLSIPTSSFCTSGSTVAVTATPPGGTLTGSGLTGSTFNPASLTPGMSYTISYSYTNTAGCISKAESIVMIKNGLTAISSGSILSCAPKQATLTASGQGAIGWYSDFATTQAIGSGSVFTTPSLSTTTTYYAATTLKQKFFRIDSLGATNSATVDHDGIAGDDRGGIAVTNNYIYVCGDDSVARYDLNLQNGINLPKADGLFSDLGNGQLYSLYNTYQGLPDADVIDSMYVTHLVALTPTLSIGTSTITLSDSIAFGWDENYNFQSGVFAGNGFIVIYSAPKHAWYSVNLQTGQVNKLGNLADPEFYQSESWAVWGVAEFNGSFSVLYRDGNTSDIKRRALPAGATTTVKAFSDVSDLASFTYAPWNHRWYMHYEGSAQFGGSSETLAYAAADDSTGNAVFGTIDCPAKAIVLVDPCTTVEETVVDADMTLMPNPNNGQFDIRVKNVENASIEVWSLDGRVVYSGTISGNEAHLTMPELASGMYIVKLSGATKSYTVKMIKH